ncbi:MAG TPA: type IV pilus modification protein PilV [Herbaspirillum sp.]|jgi:type IV pilus assembly protein PilV
MRNFIRFTQAFRFHSTAVSGISKASRIPRGRARNWRGFTLVEVLMAVFVLAVALTGMMRLHLVALRTQRQSSYQAIAAGLASDMAEMIHAWAAPGIDAPFLFDYRAGEAPPAGADCLGGASCDPDALRRFGIAQWLQTLEAALPMARVSICRDAAPWSENGFKWACSGGNAGMVIKIGWAAQAGDSTSSPPSPASQSSAAAGPQLVLNIGEPRP